MALNPSGAISLGGTTPGQSIALENGGPGTAQISLNDAAVRNLAGPAFTTPGTVIIMPTDFYGKSNLFTFTLAAGTNVNLRTAAISAGWPGSGAVQATINPGTTIQSASTGTAALVIDGAWPGGITLTNSGTIVGRGGAGGNGNSGVGGSGGTGILVSVPVTINNASGTISGGGGGGGGGSIRSGRAGTIGGGGGGGGNGFGAGGTGGPGTNSGVPGAPGGLLTGGGGGSPGAAGGAGGSNAGAGAGGSPGATGGGAAGGGGNALSGNPLVTFPALGTIYGPRV